MKLLSVVMFVETVSNHRFFESKPCDWVDLKYMYKNYTLKDFLMELETFIVK